MIEVEILNNNNKIITIKDRKLSLGEIEKILNKITDNYLSADDDINFKITWIYYVEP